MNIVYAFTKNMTGKVKPSIRSLLEHNPDVKIYILTEEDAVDLPGDPTVINVSGQKYFPESGPNYRNAFTYINLLKVCYPELLPKLNKVIHLDVDTIVCDKLDGLWKTDVRGKWFAACPEVHGVYRPFGDLYFNMGVALINLVQMRRDGIQKKMVEYLNTVRQPFADQDAWNIYGLGEDKAAKLAVRYNENRITGETDDPAIVHFCGIPDWYENRAVPRREYLDRYR